MKLKDKCNNYLSFQELSKQESLTKEILNKFSHTANVININRARPSSNFIDLMNWALENFSSSLMDKANLNKFVHNRIIIDGQFLKFCDENDIEVKCLYKDSIISWKSDESEKFFMQGVFLIKSKDVEFIHAALFHKGNQNEDEISFFIIVSEKNYVNYVKLRNQFDNWVLSRDRSNLHIRVIDGEDLPYSKDNSWDNLFLPENIKNDLKLLVEGFLSSKDFYLENKIPWKRGILLYGSAGNGKSTIIKTIMSVYNFKPVTVAPEASSDAIVKAFSYAEEQSPSLLYFEDLDSLLEKTDISSFLNLMDGVSAKNGLLVIATANDVKKLKSNITDRPSRFDRKFEIPIPTQEMAYIYMSRWFGKSLTTAKCKQLAKYSEQNKFSYAYLKELYITSMFEALAHKRKFPIEKDIEKALKTLIKDKNLLSNSNDAISMDKYFK